MGTPESDLYDEMRRDARAEAFDDYISAKADELMDGEYNPYLPENICEGMGEFSDADLQDISKCLKRGTEADANLLMATMADALYTYWRERSREKALEDYKND